MHKPVPSLELACGCTVPFRDGETPECPAHGVQRVVRTRHMPKPTFRGSATGPQVRTEDLGPFVGRLVGTERDDG